MSGKNLICQCYQTSNAYYEYIEPYILFLHYRWKSGISIIEEDELFFILWFYLMIDFYFDHFY